MQKRAPQMFLDPIQKRALSRSVHLEAVYFEALLYVKSIATYAPTFFRYIISVLAIVW